MSGDPITCERVDEGDLDTRYLAGRLSDAEAGAFEEHFFGCDRCWALVHQGATVRAALTGDEPATGELPAPRRLGRGRRWGGWAALAAASVVLAVGVWRETRGPAPRDVPDGVRGVSEQLIPTAFADSLELHLAWPRTTGAASYRVRLYGPDGAILLESEVGDTSFSVSRDSLPGSADAAVYWQVFALDELRVEVARSGLVSPTVSR